MKATSGAPFDFAVLSPAGAPDPALAIAGSRAGAFGLLNLEFACQLPPARAALSKLMGLGRGRLGVVLQEEATELWELVLEPELSGISVVAFRSWDLAGLADRVGRLAAAGRQAYLVVTSLEEALAGEAAGVHGIIAKGHEAGGWVGDETSFVLLQHLAGRVTRPVWAWGGVGLHTVSACRLAGAAGCVLDSQVLLARESPLSESVRGRVATMDGSETLCLGTSLGAPFRVYSRPDAKAVEALRRSEASRMTSDERADPGMESWPREVARSVGWGDPAGQVLAIGQDAAFAGQLAQRFRTVGGILGAFRQALRAHADLRWAEAIGQDSPLARSHGTRYPIVQGPMTRVSDRAEFAAEIAGAGALPFLALALMRAPEVKALLEDARKLLAGKPWGVGILGFVPAELRAEQLEVVRAHHPPFALIAGGRPDQARVLEQDGIPTYLHVPSPGLLRMFLKDGARRFVFEGRECGGHTGPRTSFVLWESMVETLLESIPAGQEADVHLLFAGGIHDGLSAGMVAAIAAPLIARGVRVGVLMGTAYLFTEEAVRAGAIVPGFQEAALECERTTLLESGPGQSTRCVPSPFVDEFETERRRLMKRGLGPEELKNQLEILNIGRLRIASKGVDRAPDFGRNPAAPKLVAVAPEEQWQRGMYMIGQVAALRRETCAVAELHRQIVDGVRAAASTADFDVEPEPTPPAPAAVAIVGMGCILPGAPDLPTFWSNVLNKVDAITEVPPDRWDWRLYYDEDRNAPDRTYSRWGGFVPDTPFDPVEFGMPPSSLRSIEPFQLLALAVVKAALRDAGYSGRPFNRERASVIFGAGGGGGDLTCGYVTRTSLPALFGEAAPELARRLEGMLPRWTEDSFAGLLMNVTSGRVANRFDFGGVNYTVDAACASSLAAVYQAVRDLEARTSDLVVVGGVDALENPFTFMCFSKTQAHSPTGRCRTFDASADGIAVSEGFGALVLKRLEDAERDGDRIYAVIRGAGGSSDGRDRSLTAPRPEGQIRALRRAYAQAGFPPATVGLIEAHGTGTVAGDQAEVEALSSFFSESGAAEQQCAIGSVKSMIGHTKATAGVAGLIKVALALHHKVLPATLGVTQPNPKVNFPASPFYVNTETRPWLRADESVPRRAGVSSFGFGGTDFHVAVEEYGGGFLEETGGPVDPWPAELLLFAGSRSEIAQSVETLSDKLEAGARPKLADLAYTTSSQASARGHAQATLGIVAESLEDLQAKLNAAGAFLAGAEIRQHLPQGIHYSEQPLAAAGKIAFLFPGQGSQYVNMIRDLAVAFPEARSAFERADDVLKQRMAGPVSRHVFPVPVFSEEDDKRLQAELTETNVAQPALGAADLAVFRVLEALGVEPDMVGGHSYGEFVALHAAGCCDDATLLLLSEARGRFMHEETREESGTMAAAEAAPETLRPLLEELDVTLANLNAPLQTVVSGARSAVEQAIKRCEEHDIRARLLPVGCAFHSPLVAPAQRRLAEVLREVDLQAARVPVYSNTTGRVYPNQPKDMVQLLADHLVRPVDFVSEIRAMYADGARMFVEVGPRNALTGLVARILEDQPHLAVASDLPSRPGLAQLLHCLAALAAEGITPAIDRLFQGRAVRRLDLEGLEPETGKPAYSPTTWLVNGGRARPLNEPEKPKLPVRIAFVDGPEVRSQTPSAASARNSAHFVEGDVMENQDGLQPVEGGGEAAQVMQQFQQVMQRFLEAQKT
ncbi:MAG: acyltransferase domain-containing protein, partial [Chloroflexota bacterium]|nr:acyltransferase domain-containing protein [Chloroflexota bacterium]